MGLVLIGTVLMASVVTGAGLAPPGKPRLETRQELGVRVGVPGWWQRDTDQEAAQQQIVAGDVRVWVDSRRPTRQMLLRPFEVPPLPDAANADPVRTAQNAGQEYVRRFMRVTFLNVPEVNVELSPQADPPQARAWMLTLSTDERDSLGRPRVDAIALVASLDTPGRYWVLHLADRIDERDNANRVAQQTAFLLQLIVNSAEFGQSPA